MLKKNTGLDEIREEYSISHASYQAYFVSLVACTVRRLSGRRSPGCSGIICINMFHISMNKRQS